MKHFVLIFIFSFSKLCAQLSPPDLRCLEVLPNGDVKLSWIPPADAGNTFFSYELFFSTSRLGPFNSLGVNLSPITTNSFVHTGTTSIAQTCFYYMVTKSGPGGSTSSATSATLQTLHLNPIPQVINLNITFNHLRTPKLESSAETYTVIKEYPIGTWNNLSVTSSTVYPDTITTCGYKLAYRVSVADNSGCVSLSNIVEGLYENTKPPEQPYVDSISVLPNGNTVLSWQPPVDKDVDKYEIQYKVGSTNQVIDLIYGRNNTFYLYNTTTANSNPVGIFAKALDSCQVAKGSSVDNEIRTMFLKTSYNDCKQQTTLIWNKYRWASLKGEVGEKLGEYRIYYSVDGGIFQRIGATTDTNFVHSNVDPGKNVCYFVRVINERKTITSSSNRYCFFTAQVPAPQTVYVKTATIIDETSAEIKVYMDTLASSKGIYIERSDDNIEYKNIGFLPYAGSPHYSFTDGAIKSRSQSYYYKAVVVDDCGNRREGSKASKTILLKVNEDESQMFTKQLSWSAYEGFSGSISGYNVYRIVNDDITNALVGSTDPLTTSFTDNLEEAATAGAKVEYRVEAVEGIGNIYGFFEKSKSNPAPVYMEGRLYVPNAFAPAGVNKTWLPITYFIDKTDYRVSVFNRWGKKVFETNSTTQAWDGNDCPPDVYVYLIDYKNARGEFMQLKGHVQLLR